MSGENVEIVRAAIDALNRGEWASALEEAAPDFELDMSRSIGPLRGVYERDQVMSWVEDFTGSWESVRIEPHEFIDAGDDVIVPWTAHFVGRDGVEVQSRVTWSWTVRNGMIERASLFQDRQDAFGDDGPAE